MSAPAPYLQLFDVFGDAVVAELRARADERTDDLVPSTVRHGERRTHDVELRRSMVATQIDDLRPLLEARLRALLPHVRKELGLPHFPLGSIELQYTVHGDGDFYSRHADETQPGTDGSRAITFVYYFHEDGPRFSGGALRVHDAGRGAEPRDGHAADGDPGADTTWVDLDPATDSIVFFASDRDHEVRPVRLDEGGGRRCTVNGWFRLGDVGQPRQPELPRDTLSRLQARLVPRLTDAGVAVRPIPRAAHLALAAHWARQRTSATPRGGGLVRPAVLPLGPYAQLVDQLRPVHEAWAGCELVATGCDGIVHYHEGHRLPMHTDRCRAHVISSVVHLDGADWPLRVDVDGRTHDLHLGPGQMALLEGAACPHGRVGPAPASGATVLFLSYRPTDWTLTGDDVVDRARADGLLGDDDELTDRYPGPRHR